MININVINLKYDLYYERSTTSTYLKDKPMDCLSQYPKDGQLLRVFILFYNEPAQQNKHILQISMMDHLFNQIAQYYNLVLKPKYRYNLNHSIIISIITIFSTIGNDKFNYNNDNSNNIFIYLNNVKMYLINLLLSDDIDTKLTSIFENDNILPYFMTLDKIDNHNIVITNDININPIGNNNYAFIIYDYNGIIN